MKSLSRQNSVLQTMRRQSSISKAPVESKKGATGKEPQLRRSLSRLSKQQSVSGPVDVDGPPDSKSPAANATKVQEVTKQDSSSSRKSPARKGLKIDIQVPPKKHASTATLQPSAKPQQKQTTQTLNAQVSFSQKGVFADDDSKSPSKRGGVGAKTLTRRKSTLQEIEIAPILPLNMAKRKSLGRSVTVEALPARKRDQKAAEKKTGRQGAALQRSSTLRTSKSKGGKSSAASKQRKRAIDRRTNRTRKSQCQKDALWQMYQDLKGKTPQRQQILDLADELNLKVNQIYKWFWDTKKKVQEDTNMARDMRLFQRQQSFVSIDSKGNLQPPKEITGVDGTGGGERMTPQQIKTALKIHKAAKEKEEDFEKIASNLGLNIELMALEIVSAPSPTNRRQIVRRLNAGGSSTGKASMQHQNSGFSNAIAPSFQLNMLTNPRASIQMGSRQGSLMNIGSKATGGFGSARNSRDSGRAKQPGSGQRITRQQSSFSQAIRHEHQGKDLATEDAFFNTTPTDMPVNMSRKHSVRLGFGSNQEGIGTRDELLASSPSPKAMRRNRSIISRQQSILQPTIKPAGKLAASPMNGRRRLDARLDTAEMFDHDGIVMSEGKRGEGTPSVITPQMMVPQMRQITNDMDPFMRMNSGLMNKQDYNMDDFDQMLGGNPSFMPIGGQDPTQVNMRKQQSIGGQSFFKLMQDNVMGMGDTGTTPRNEFGGMLMMTRGANNSFDQRHNSIISPFLEGSRRSILNPTPLRHNPSFMSTSNSILPNVPNFGGADNS